MTVTEALTLGAGALTLILVLGIAGWLQRITTAIEAIKEQLDKLDKDLRG